MREEARKSQSVLEPALELEKRVAAKDSGEEAIIERVMLLLLLLLQPFSRCMNSGSDSFTVWAIPCLLLLMFRTVCHIFSLHPLLSKASLLPALLLPV